MARGRLRRTTTALIIGFSTTWLSVALIGCGGSSNDPSPSQAPGTIGAAGGQVSSADRHATLTVPPNAIATDTIFIIEPAIGAPSSDRIVGTVFDVEPTGTVFSVPAQLTLTYDALPEGVDATTLQLGTLDQGVWTVVTGSLPDAANKTVTASITHLSMYVVLQPGPTNHAPIASAGQQYVGTVDQALTLYAAGSTDQDGDPLTYTWNFGDLSPPSATTSQTITHVYSAAGVYTATLTVTDGRGGSASATAVVTITALPPGNQPPIANAGGPYSGTVGQIVDFNGAGSSDPDGDLLTYVWDFGDQTSDTGATPSHMYSAAGTFHVTLTVSDGHGGTASTTVDAVIAAAPPVNHPPTAGATIPSTGLVNLPLTFTGFGSDPDGDLLTFSWNFGDGSATTPTAAATHTYATAGTFTVTLTVSDGRGGFASTSGTIVITVPTLPTAVSQQYTIVPRQSAPIYYSRYAITLNGSGVPPLTFRIVTFPTNADPRESMDMIQGAYYQWWDPATSSWRPECYTGLSPDPSCEATTSSHVDLTPDPATGLPKGDVTVSPPNSPVTVIYTPAPCFWFPPPNDSFTFVVTDATGMTSDPATISIATDTSITCHEPTF